jgi:hypothetical protein
MKLVNRNSMCPAEVIDLFKTGFSQKSYGSDESNEQQRHFNVWQISKLQGEVTAIQTSLKLIFTLQQ